jgi:bile acid:Na+ symporter, BASS family
MESSIILSIFLPVALGIIMFGMGLTLEIRDFKRVFQFPKAASIGLVNQLIILPVLGFAICSSLILEPAMAMGVMLLAFCPGGATSNLITYLSKGDVALSITLTAISSLLTVFTIPILVNLSLAHFMEGNNPVPLPIFNTILSIIAITLIPTFLGMFIRSKYPIVSEKARKPVNIASTLLFILIYMGALLSNRTHLVDFFIQVGPAALLLNIGSMLIGYLSAKFANLNRPQRVTISLETGLQNGTLAITIAMSPLMLDNAAFATAAAIYSIFMFLSSGSIIFWSRSRLKRLAI